MAIRVQNLKIDSQTGSDTTLFLTWKFEKKNTDFYRIYWYYDTGNGVWFKNEDPIDTELHQVTISRPSNATRVKVSVRPVAKKRKVKGKKTAYWQAEATTVIYEVAKSDPPPVPDVPTVEIEKYKLTAYVDIAGSLNTTDRIEFLVIADDRKFTSGVVRIPNSSITKRAIFSCNVVAGKQYRVRARAINTKDSKGTIIHISDWSEYSSEVTTIPSSVSNVRVYVESETSMRVTWTGNKTAKEYEVQYTTKKTYFDSSSEVKSITVQTTYAYITGMETGHEWYFRVRAINDEGESGWSPIVYKLLGSKPNPPTTWSLSTTAIVGDNVTLYWTHNTEDGSRQIEAQIQLTINGKSQIITVDTSKEDPDEALDKIYSYNLNLKPYSDGAEVLWRVRTRGILATYSDWSVQRTINTYAPPTLTLMVNDGEEIISQFPINITAMAGPDTQRALSYHISITATTTHEIENDIGEVERINAGDEIYSRIIYTNVNTLALDLLPSDLILQNNQIYNVKVTVSMDSGLTAVAEEKFEIDWSDYIFAPTAQISIDERSLSAYITPYCEDEETEELIENVTLSVYRRQYDGGFVEIATGLENDGVITVTDPHPSLDYARYRIVARSTITGALDYSDIPGYPIQEPSIVIQWDEEWIPFDTIEGDNPDETEIPAWSGSMLRLSYNVDVSESTEPDRSVVEYIGRQHPVSYYGTQKGSNANWNAEIPAEDLETIYALRRLANWMGDVYVREPNGASYWAQISVSISMKHKEVTVPVSFSITRVEGGI